MSKRQTWFSPAYTFLVIFLVMFGAQHWAQADTTITCDGLVKEFGQSLVERKNLLYLYETKMLPPKQLTNVEDRIEVVQSTLESIEEEHKRRCRGNNEGDK